jgi:phage baseplate assembly protein W
MPIGTIDSYSDLDMNLGFHPMTKDVRKKTKEDSIKQSVRNLILTSPGEKLFNPGWGCNLRGFLFEPITDTVALDIKDMVKITLQNYEPRIEVIDIIVLPMLNRDGYEIGLYYKLRETTTVINQTVSLAERVR